MPDCIIKNGTVITGTGDKGFAADVAITGDRIEAIEPRIAANGSLIVDARGKVVCPGIIDPHSHADLTIHKPDQAKLLEPLVRQGITTFVGGNCGLSMAPLSTENHDEVKMYLEGFTASELEGNVTWSDTAGFMEHLEKNGMVMNCALLAPHGLLRIDAMGMDARAADNDEIRRMCRELETCMDAGCLGLSTGLQYMPGLQSETRELVHLGRTLKKYDGIYTSHLRTYMNEFPRAIDELVTVARENDIRAQVSHLFWVPDLGPMGPIIRYFAGLLIDLSRYWTLPAKLDAEIEKQVERVVAMRKKGLSIGMDVMPTTTTFTHLMAYFPPWVLEGDKEDVARRLLSKKARARMKRDIESGNMVWPHTGDNAWSLNLFRILGWDCTRIMSVVSEKNKHLEGRRISDIANQRGMHPFDVACDLLVDEEARVLVFSSLGRPEDNFTEQSLFAAFKHPEVAISTDTILMGFGKPSHLFYGAYPKFFSRYVRDKKMMPLETGVRKVTGLPAEHFGLKQRGFLREGYFADILIFDPKTISPNVDFFNPVGRPSGIEHVFINGRHILDGGNFNPDPMPGRLLKRE